MITIDDLKSLEDSELDQLAQDVEKELTRRQRRRAREAVKQARALLAAAGFEAQIYPIGSAPAEGKAEEGKGKGKLPPVPAGIYRHPERPEDIWEAGKRGRTPAWVRDALAAGEDLSRYRVTDNDEDAA